MHLLTVTLSALLLALGACGSTAASESETAGAQPSPAPATTAAPGEDLAVAYFAGGCFWCTEASFERLEGVQAVVSGYSGGPEVDPTYQEVANGRTGHAETVAVYYDSAAIDYPTLLEVFFVAHDPTTLNRQGPDRGPQYRSAVFYGNPAEERLARAAIARLDASGAYGAPAVTEVTAFETFYPAEDYHQGYYELNPTNPYIVNVSRPKVRKVEKRFADLLKERYRS